MNPRLNPMFVTIAATIAVQVLMSVGITQAGPAPDKKVKQPAYTEFSNPEMVQILGYNDNEVAEIRPAGALDPAPKRAAP